MCPGSFKGISRNVLSVVKVVHHADFGFVPTLLWLGSNVLSVDLENNRTNFNG